MNMSKAFLRRPAGVIAALALFAGLALPGFAAASDRNHDRLPDRWEKQHRLSLKVDQSGRDQDRDGLTNLSEYRSGTDPRATDSDDDGVGDRAEDRDHDGLSNLAEQRHGTRQDERDSDHDGVEDGDGHRGGRDDSHGGGDRDD